MSSNSCYGIKDAEFNFSYSEPEWLSPYEVINRLNISDRQNQLYNIFPRELILNDSKIVDVILLAKYRNKYGSLKLKSVLFSQLISINANVSNRIQILNLPKDSYFWRKVENNHIPQFALRAGYDSISKQFSYIGRMKFTSLLKSQNEQTNHSTSALTTTNLMGSLTHVYEYIPAIVFGLHDLSFLDESFLLNFSPDLNNNNTSNNENRQVQSFWSRLRAAIQNKNSHDMDFNFISSSYEVLCLRKQPATLKQLCVIKLNKIHDSFICNETCSQKERLNYLGLFRTLNTQPNSIRQILWPCYLMPGTCIVKNGKMRSSNCLYEVYLNAQGSLKLAKLFNNLNNHLSAFREVVTFEKNVESMMVSGGGVFLVYDNNQPMRKPNVLYKHTTNNSKSDMFLLEISDTGYLRVVVVAIPGKIESFVNILNLNDYFSKLSPPSCPLSLPNNRHSKSDHSFSNPTNTVTASTNNGLASIKFNSLTRVICINIRVMFDAPARMIYSMFNSMIQKLAIRLRLRAQLV